MHIKFELALLFTFFSGQPFGLFSSCAQHAKQFQICINLLKILNLLQGTSLHCESEFKTKNKNANELSKIVAKSTKLFILCQFNHPSTLFMLRTRGEYEGVEGWADGTNGKGNAREQQTQKKRKKSPCLVVQINSRPHTTGGYSP
jgi:hypothetical protein